MKKNVGNIDSIVRMVATVLIVVLFVGHIVTGVIGMTLMLVAIVLLLTGVFGFCPLYYVFGIRTCKYRD